LANERTPYGGNPPKGNSPPAKERGSAHAEPGESGEGFAT
jgi:hypothetical protein